MRSTVLLFLLSAAGWTGAYAQESIKVETRKQPPPAALVPELLGALDGQSLRIRDGQDKDFAEIWLRKATTTSEKPSGAKGAIQFPFLADGELLGILEFTEEGHDYRDQSIAKGIYTMRYGLQPVNGDHLGVSTYRDYVLLLPASKDKALSPPHAQAVGGAQCRVGGDEPSRVVLALDGPERRQAVGGRPA